MSAPSPKIHKLLQSALQSRQQGDWAQAEVYCRQALSLAPKNPGALNLLGVLVFQQGRAAEAEELVQKAASLDQRNPELLKNLGAILHASGKLEQALSTYRKAVALAPQYVPALLGLADALLVSEQFAEAETAYRKVIALGAAPAKTWVNLGVCLQALNKPQDAADCCRKVVEMSPDDATAHYNLGSILLELDDPAAALPCFQRAVALAPQTASIHASLGNALRKLDRPDEAVAAFEEAIRLDPACAEAYNNLGYLLYERENLDAALALFVRAAELRPDYAEACYNIALVLQYQGRLAEALSVGSRAIELDPKNGDAQWNQALSLLLSGDLAQGWAQYEYRFSRKTDGVVSRAFPQPRWAGESLRGKKILVWGEQGLGEDMMFANLLPDLVAQGGQVIFECTYKVAPLLARSFPEVTVVPRLEPTHVQIAGGNFDFQTPAGSLMRWLRPTLESFPRHSSYLKAPPERVAFWKEKLDGLNDTLKVGISWRSKILGGKRKMNYSVLDDWAPIFAIPGVTFINLQYDECAEELAAARKRFGVEVRVFDEVDLFNDLDEAAALTQAMDVVVAPCTSVAFLAAALGVPTLQFGLQYGYWESLGTAGYPWFPAVRCFNRRCGEGWGDALRALAEALTKLQVTHG